METASSAAVHGVEDVRAGDRDGEAPLPSSPPLSSFNLSHHASQTSSPSHLGRHMECWICFDSNNTPADPIVTHRCRCRGSVGFVHQRCIDKWVIQKHNNTCRSCGAVYRLGHSDYPPGAQLPLDFKGRTVFLLKFLVQPLLKEIVEALVCALLRFLCVPMFLGAIYNYHRLTVLLWIVTGSATTPETHASSASASPLVAWLFNTDSADVKVSYTVCLAAWAETLLVGLVVCTATTVVSVTSRQWHKYFKNARRKHERDGAAAMPQEAEAPVAMAAVDGLRHDTDNNRQATAATVDGAADRLDGAGPEAAPADAREDDGTSSGEDDDSTTDGSSSGDSDSDDDHPAPRLSFVDEMFDLVDWVKSGAGGGGLRRLLPSLAVQLRYGVVLTLLLRCPLGRVVIAVACIVLVVGWRYRYSRHILRKPKLRFHEVAERVPLLSRDEVQTLFYVYLVDAFFFYCILPELGGITLHYALSPYLDIGMNGGLLNFFYGLTVWKLAVYWGIGALLVMGLTAVELTVVSALFANGVELFFVRSFDARWDTALGYWRCVITQVFDTDPPRIVYGFVRVAVVELLVLLIFMRIPFWGMSGVRNLVWGDGVMLAASPFPSSDVFFPPPPTKMAFDFAISDGYDMDDDLTFAEWRRLEALQLFDEKVFMPLEAAYIEMGEFVPDYAAGIPEKFLLRRDPRANASVTVHTPEKVWAQVWGSLPDTAVFTFDLLDPSSAARVAEFSEGFRDTLARVRAPLEWLRLATRRASVCDTLTALSAPVDFYKNDTHSASAVDIEGLLKPPLMFPRHPQLSLAKFWNFHIFGWEARHLKVPHRSSHVSNDIIKRIEHSVYKDERQRPSLRMHTENIVNCYVAFMQVTQPFMRVGRWHTKVMDWGAMLLVRNIFFDYGALLLLYVLAFFTAVSCFVFFPLQRAQLRLLLPFVRWVGRHVVHMEDYLFDQDQIRAVEDFMRAEFDDELVLPPMVEPMGFNRREDYLDESRIPSYVVLRRVVVSVLFFMAASLMVWTVPVLCGSLLLSFTSNALPVLLGATLMSFFIWSPSLLARSAVVGAAFSLTIVVAVPLLFMMYVAPTLQTLWRFPPSVVTETFQRHYNIRQMVDRYSESDGGWRNKDGGSRRSSREEDGDNEREVEAENDEWESVSSSEAASEAEMEGQGQTQNEEEEEEEKPERAEEADENGRAAAAPPH
ncbi:putative Zn-finger domain protein [Leptomonas pyrrhocoris]|uniref:Putative Zn-finger domain protein n=1 Tax=Leptomonas pyrrhocoris TaxID=157538 RepID=A0A0N0DVL6_LEPPY|nr:putative Zn-finger domain protein [Leptomonas pyrrhocoris]KPA80541.1 putative Zn-finger domain protein [Leptomonas pyrrhocoris]|eukprot:XP_015658980.1 putative Zn-finger domain protein [Leptomonas pyrrhocoris]